MTFQTGENKQLSEHFNSSELECHCGKPHSNFIDNRLLTKLEELRALIGAAIMVNCGYRCPEHNKEVGGVSNSQHCLGKAADIKVPGLSLGILYDRAKEVGFTGLGRYNTFIHVDIRDGAFATWNG